MVAMAAAIARQEKIAKTGYRTVSIPARTVGNLWIIWICLLVVVR